VLFTYTVLFFLLFIISEGLYDLFPIAFYAIASPATIFVFNFNYSIFSIADNTAHAPHLSKCIS